MIDKWNGWNTKDEIKFLNYMASNNGRVSKISTADMIQRVQSWLDNFWNVKWGQGVHQSECKKHAVVLLDRLKKIEPENG